jgi:transcriptional regulator with XRE-family HTH domain
MNRGLTLRGLAEAIDVPKSTLDRAEKGIEPRSPQHKLALASFYGFAVTEIWPTVEAVAA